MVSSPCAAPSLLNVSYDIRFRECSASSPWLLPVRAISLKTPVAGAMFLFRGPTHPHRNKEVWRAPPEFARQVPSVGASGIGAAPGHRARAACRRRSGPWRPLGQQEKVRLLPSPASSSVSAVKVNEEEEEEEAA